MWAFIIMNQLKVHGGLSALYIIKVENCSDKQMGQF